MGYLGAAILTVVVGAAILIYVRMTQDLRSPEEIWAEMADALGLEQTDQGRDQTLSGAYRDRDVRLRRLYRSVSGAENADLVQVVHEVSADLASLPERLLLYAPPQSLQGREQLERIEETMGMEIGLDFETGHGAFDAQFVVSRHDGDLYTVEPGLGAVRDLMSSFQPPERADEVRRFLGRDEVAEILLELRRETADGVNMYALDPEHQTLELIQERGCDVPEDVRRQIDCLVDTADALDDVAPSR